MNVLEKILEEIKKNEENYNHRGHSPAFLKGACSMYVDAKQIIRSHMNDVPDKNVGEWIPVSKRLPECEQEVWISTKTDCIRRGTYTKKYGFSQREGFICDDGFMCMNTANAWMPYFVPEPYKPEEVGQ